MGFSRQEYWSGVPLHSPQRSLAGYNPLGRKKSDTTEQLTHLLSVSKLQPDSEAKSPGLMPLISGPLPSWSSSFLPSFSGSFYPFSGTYAPVASLVAQLIKTAHSAEDLLSIPGLGRSPGEGNGYPLQYSGLENPMDCIVHGVSKSQTGPSDCQYIPMEKIKPSVLLFLSTL